MRLPSDQCTSRCAAALPARATAKFSTLTIAAVLALAAVLPVNVAVAATRAMPPAPRAPGSDHPVVLITGDVVHATSAGVAVEASPRSGDSSQFQIAHLGSATYVIPEIARPYVGRYLDPELFNVAALAAQQSTGQCGPTMRFSVTPGVGIGAGIAGLRVTARSATSVEGCLTPAGSKAFVQLLAAHRRADLHRRGSAAGPLWPAVTWVAPETSQTAAARVTPAFPERTLSVHVLDRHGAPVRFTLVTLTNTDDQRRYSAFVPVVNGLAKVSAPAGDYSAYADVTDVDNVTGRLIERIVIATDFDFRASGQALVLDARTATSKPTIRTPRRAGVQSLQLEWDRVDNLGAPAVGVNQIYSDPSVDVRITPAPAARIGAQHWVTYWSLASTPARGIPYSYDLLFDDARVNADQSRAVASGQLATVHARYFSDGQPRAAQFGRAPLLRGGYQIVLGALPTPSVRTEQVRSPAGTLWTSVLIGDATTLTLGVTDGWRLYPPGAQSAADWLRPALLPGFQVPTNDSEPFECPACRSGGELSLQLAALTDSTPGHAGILDIPADDSRSARLRLYRDGVLVADLPNTTTAQVPVPAGPGSYRLLFELDRTKTGALGSIRARTELTFASSEHQGQQAPVSWTCAADQPDAPCRVLPVLQVRAPLPVDLQGRIAAGADHLVDVVVSHVSGATTSSITKLVVETSGNGSAWTTAPTWRQSDGHYTALLPTDVPSQDHTVDLRITTADATGSTLQQTSWAAYSIPTR